MRSLNRVYFLGHVISVGGFAPDGTVAISVSTSTDSGPHECITRGATAFYAQRYAHPGDAIALECSASTSATGARFLVDRVLWVNGKSRPADAPETDGGAQP